MFQEFWRVCPNSNIWDWDQAATCGFIWFGPWLWNMVEHFVCLFSCWNLNEKIDATIWFKSFHALTGDGVPLVAKQSRSINQSIFFDFLQKPCWMKKRDLDFAAKRVSRKNTYATRMLANEGRDPARALASCNWPRKVIGISRKLT